MGIDTDNGKPIAPIQSNNDDDRPEDETDPDKPIAPNPSSNPSQSTSPTASQNKIKQNFGKLKTKLKKAAKWLNENKDKTLDDIMVERWKEKCTEDSLKNSLAQCKRKGMKKNSKSSSTNCKNRQSSKKKACLDAGLAEDESDSPEIKEIKDEMRSLVSENPDDAYDTLTATSSKTFSELEEEEKKDLETGTQLEESCQSPENRRSKRSTPCPPSTKNAKKHYVDPTDMTNIQNAAVKNFPPRKTLKPKNNIKDLIDKLGAARFNELTQGFLVVTDEE